MRSSSRENRNAFFNRQYLDFAQMGETPTTIRCLAVLFKFPKDKSLIRFMPSSVVKCAGGQTIHINAYCDERITMLHEGERIFSASQRILQHLISSPIDRVMNFVSGCRDI